MYKRFVLRTLFGVWVLAVCACGTQKLTKEKDSLPMPTQPPAQTSSKSAPRLPPSSFEFDIDELESKLNLGRRFDGLGLHEKRFSPCALGYKEAGCDSMLFSMINFQVVCRDTVGTTESSDHILTPLANKVMTLKVNKRVVETQTDNNGYAQMRFVTKVSERNSRFILTATPNILGLRVHEVNKIIVPDDWCNN